jgi:hypothetical protein
LRENVTFYICQLQIHATAILKTMRSEGLVLTQQGPDYVNMTGHHGCKSNIAVASSQTDCSTVQQAQTALTTSSSKQLNKVVFSTANMKGLRKQTASSSLSCAGRVSHPA